MLRAFNLSLSRRVFRISGPDARKMLQGLVTNDMDSLQKKDHSAFYTAFLNHKGRFLFDAFIHSHSTSSEEDQNENLLIDVHSSFLESFPKHIRKYKLRSKIELEDTVPSVSITSVMSPSPEILANACDLLQKYAKDLAISSVISDPRIDLLGLRIIHQQSSSSDILQALTELSKIDTLEDEGIYRAQRMALGIPEAPSELKTDKSLPLESNLQWLNAISYSKGCYLGQELTARTHYKGVIRKRIVPFKIASSISADSSLPLSVYSVQCHHSNPSKQVFSETDDLSIVDTQSGSEFGKVLSITNTGVLMGLARLDAIYHSVSFSLRNSTGDIVPETVVVPYIPSWWRFDNK